MPTRKENTLDLFYVNLPDAYKCAALPPLGNSDHDMAQLIPKNRPILKCGKITKKTVTIWTEEATQQLQGCLDCTDWDIFIRSSKNIDELCTTVTEYVKFCEDLFIVRKRVLSYPNTKPWVNKEIRSFLKDKQEAFKDKERENFTTINCEIKKKIAISKINYKSKIEAMFKSNNNKETWLGLRTMIGNTEKKTTLHTDNINEYVNNPNSFYARFKNPNPNIEHSSALENTLIEKTKTV